MKTSTKMKTPGLWRTPGIGLFILIISLLSPHLLWSQVVTIVGWDVSSLIGGTNLFGPSPFTPSQTDLNVTAGGLTRASGVTISGSGASAAWGGNGFDGPVDAATAVAANNFATFTIAPNAGSSFTLTSISAYNIRRSGTGPTTGQWQYQIGAGAFNNIGTPITYGGNTAAAGNNQTAINLTGITALANVPSTSSVTFRLVSWGATGSAGTWYINNRSVAGLDLEILGNILSSPTLTTTTASAITLNSVITGGNISSNGGAAVTARGVVFATSANPTTASPLITSDGTGNGIFPSTYSSLIANTKYFYRAYATNAVGTSYGNENTFGTLPAAPLISAGSSPTENGFTANWSAPAGGTVVYTYTLEIATDAAFSTIVQTNTLISSASVSRVNTSLLPATGYYYRIKAVNATGSSAWSAVSPLITTAPPLGPTPITTFATTVTTNSAILNGTVNANGGPVATVVFNYGLSLAYGSTAAATPGTVSGTTTEDVSAGISSLGINTLYHFRVKANAENGIDGQFFTLASVPVAPSVSSPTATTLSITLNSDLNPAITEYAIIEVNSGLYLQANGSLNVTPIWQTRATWGTLIVTGLSSSTSYPFQIKARNGDLAETTFGAPTVGITSGCPLITGLTATGITDGSVQLNWNVTTGNYEYFVDQNPVGPASGTMAGTNSQSVSGLSATTGYYAHVRSVCGSNFSAWTNIPFTTTTAPVGFVVFDFNTCNCTGTVSPSSVAANVNATDFSRGAGINYNAGGGVYNSNNWISANQAAAQSANQHHNFAVSPAAGYQITYTSISLTHQRSNTGPQNAQIGYSTNNGVSWTYSLPQTLPSGTTNYPISWTFPSAFTSTGTVVFRVWAWGGASAGTYRSENVQLNGIVNSICNPPSIQATTTSFPTVVENAADITWNSAGAADYHYLFMTAGSTGTPVLVNGTDYTGNSSYGAGSAAGAWYCIYNGTGTSVSVTNLSPVTTYRVYAVNGNCTGADARYNNSTNATNPANFTTPVSTMPNLSSGALGTFGTLCINHEDETAVQVAGVNLTGTAVTITAPAGFSVSLVSGESYSSSIVLPYAGSDLSTTVYVRFLPTSVTSYSTNLQVSGGGASALNVPVSGTGINTLPTIITGGVSFIGTTGATISGSLTLGCASVFSSYGIEYSANSSFTVGNGALIQSSFTGDNFSVPITNLAINTIYYYRAYGVNGATTYYGATGSFSTLSGLQETLYNYADNISGTPIYVHPTLAGTTLTKTGFGSTSTCGSGFSGFMLGAGATVYNPVSNPYVNFNITPSVYGNQASIEKISVQLRRTANGATSVMMAYSIDNGATWIDKGVAESPDNTTTCGDVSNHSWTIGTPVTIGAPYTVNTIKIRLFYFRPDGITGGNNQILNFVVLGKILQSPNTFYSVATGNFTDAIWSPVVSGPGSAIDFTSSINAVIQSGHTVSVNVPEVSIKNLTVSPGGNLRSNSTNVSTMRRINISETMIVNGSTGTGASFDALGVDIEGGACIIGGTGTINLAQIRKQSTSNSSANLTLNANVNLRFPGTAFYNNAPNTSFNLVVAAGKTLNVIGSGADGNFAIDGASGSEAGQYGGSVTVNGTLNVSGDLLLASPNNSGLYPCNFTIDASGVVTTQNIDLRIIASNTVGINAGGKLNVNGLMNQRQGTFFSNNGLYLSSGASLLHGAGTTGGGGDVTGTITVRRIGTSQIGVYNYWSTPVSGNSLYSIIQGSAGSGSSGAPNTYDYNAMNATGSDIPGVRAGWVHRAQTDLMTPAKGYITTGGGNAIFTGPANNGSINLPLVHGTFTEFNLVGNPYPSSLSASDFILANTANIQPALYFWDDDASLGSGYSPADYAVTNILGTVATGGNGNSGFFTGGVASGQGFFVEAKPAGGSVIFNNSMRNSNNSFFFDAEASSKIWVSLTNDAGLYNETLLGFLPEASDARDELYDARKLPGNENIALYTTLDSSAYSIQAWGELTEGRIIPLGVDAKVEGNHTISLKNLVNVDASVLIYLEDIQSGVFHNLRQGNYSFNVTDSMGGAERFRLHFQAPVNVSSIDETCLQNDGAIIINAPENSWNYIVLNESNQEIAAGVAGNSTTISNLEDGSYELLLTTADGYSIVQNYTIADMSFVTVEAQIPESALTHETVIFSANVNGQSTISWNFGDGSPAVTGVQTTHAYSEPGVYEVTTTASNEFCSSVATQIIFVTNVVTGVSTLNSGMLNIYPNPASDFITIAGVDENSHILISDLTGKQIDTLWWNGNSKMIDVSGLANGVYIASVQIEGTIKSVRLVIAR